MNVGFIYLNYLKCDYYTLSIYFHKFFHHIYYIFFSVYASWPQRHFPPPSLRSHRERHVGGVLFLVPLPVCLFVCTPGHGTCPVGPFINILYNWRAVSLSSCPLSLGFLQAFPVFVFNTISFLLRSALSSANSFHKCCAHGIMEEYGGGHRGLWWPFRLICSLARLQKTKANPPAEARTSFH